MKQEPEPRVPSRTAEHSRTAESAKTVPQLAGFIPFVAIGILHLAGLISDQTWLSTATKPLILLSLAFALVWTVRSPSSRTLSRPVVMALVGLGLGWVGDVALMVEGQTWFLAGLGAFLLAHVAYIVLFVRYLGHGRVRAAALAYLLWFACLMVLLWPHLGGMLVPVLVYGVVIGAMAVTATRCGWIITSGAAVFLLSDSLLAVNRFVPDAGLWQPDVLIMLSYIAGQGLIVLGVARAAVAAAQRPASRR